MREADRTRRVDQMKAGRVNRMTRAEHCRAKAEECDQLARTTT
jgi:hypothetical protein